MSPASRSLDKEVARGSEGNKLYFSIVLFSSEI